MSNDGMRGSPRMPWRARLCAAALLLAGLLSGCDAAVVAGTERVSTPDLGSLDIGESRTTPPEVPPNDNDTYGRVIESARLAEAVINPYKIDPALAYGGSTLLPTSGRTSVLAPEIALTPLANAGMIAGYSVTGTDVNSSKPPTLGQSKALRLTVLRFRTDTIARTAALQLSKAEATRGPEAVGLDVPGFADAYSHWRPQLSVAVTTLAHKSYVVVVWLADRAPDPAALARLTATALTAELPLLDSFEPTPPDKLSALSFDEDGMLRRLLHPNSSRWPYPVAYADGTAYDTTWFLFTHGSGVVYGPTGIGHLFGRNPETLAKSSGGDGVDRAAFINDWWLLRLLDATRARKMHNKVVEVSKVESDTVTAPNGVPDAACFRLRNVADDQRDTRYSCYVLDGRYWALVTAADEQTVRQRAAAQYALLVNSR